jgi:predicted nucleic-acid-binding Zn-ribbon protein
MKHHYSVLVCRKCQNKNVVRNDRAKTFQDGEYLCAACGDKERNEKKFRDSLGEASNLIKDTHVDGKHRYVFVDCSGCGDAYWARFDAWLNGFQKCWACSHPCRQSHGKTGTDLHRRWMGVIRRTVSDEPSRARVYKDRGITMCDEWRRNFLSFERWALANGYEKNLLLDRIDNSKGYSPENCRFVNHKESTRNRRKAVYI